MDQAAETLAAFASAVRHRDPAQASALAPTGAAEQADGLATLVDNATALRVRDFTVRYVDELGARDADGAWSAVVAATWAYGALDATPARTEIVVRLVEEGDRVALAGFPHDEPGGHPRPVWLSGPVTVVRTEETLVVDAGGAVSARRIDRLARRALPVVRTVLPAWDGPLVVEVPPAPGGLDAALGVAAGEYDDIAAVTTSIDGSTAAGAPVHVYVNAAVLDRLRPIGAQVVISHEATHVATAASASSAPAWLLEGFADYVALRDVDLPLSVTAARLARVVRRDGLPHELPGVADLSPGARDLEAAYEASWLACATIADVAGEAALMRFARAMDSGPPLAPTLRRTTGLSIAALTRRWQGRLADLPA